MIYIEKNLFIVQYIAEKSKNKSIRKKKYYQFIYESVLPSFHKMFDLKVLEDYKEFYNIMYSLDTLNGRTDLTIFLSENNEKLTVSMLKKEVGTTYKIYLFKNIIKDLLGKISKEDFTFEECFFLYNYIKVYIIDDEGDLKYAENGELVKNNDGEVICEYEEDFLLYVNAIENIFYEFICEFYGVSFDDINMFKERRNDLNLLLEYENANFLDILYEENREIFLSILNKFPILKEISYTKPCYEFYLDFFEENSEMYYSRVRMLP